MNNNQTVFIVDDDEAIRDSLCMLFDSLGIDNQSFGSGQAFLGSLGSDISGCLISDIRMPGLSGLDLQQALLERKIDIPVIFISGHGDIPMAVEAMRNGAHDFIRKPFREQDLLDRINEALSIDRQKRESRDEASAISRKMASLTEREQQVLEHISAGEANKVVAAELGISERTVEVHRASIMKKLEVRSLAQLVRMKLTVDQTNRL